jgi:hypothetical protein
LQSVRLEMAKEAEAKARKEMIDGERQTPEEQIDDVDCDTSPAEYLFFALELEQVQ